MYVKDPLIQFFLSYIIFSKFCLIQTNRLYEHSWRFNFFIGCSHVLVPLVSIQYLELAYKFTIDLLLLIICAVPVDVVDKLFRYFTVKVDIRWALTPLRASPLHIFMHVAPSLHCRGAVTKVLFTSAAILLL